MSVPFEGGVMISYVSGSLLSSSAESAKGSSVSSSVSVVMRIASGAMLKMSNSTVPLSQALALSQTSYVTESRPTKPASGV